MLEKNLIYNEYFICISSLGNKQLKISHQFCEILLFLANVYYSVVIDSDFIILAYLFLSFVYAK